MSVYRSWNDATLKSRLKVPSGKGGRIIIAHVGSRDTGLLDGAGLIFIGESNTGDYHNEMNSRRWLEWLQEDVFPNISGQVLVVDRAPYHLTKRKISGCPILTSPVAHPELNPIEMVWGTVKMAAKRGNTNFTLKALKELVAAQFAKITPEEWLKYELHAIKMEDSYRRLEKISDQVAAAFDDEQLEVEGSGGDGEGEDAEDGVGGGGR
eukprot:contig_4078_g895